ncbi:hypothetical protein WISP_23422 [Willisornis vidua]|uniref:Uncharacterized protein n=1 Tax=Willisornis vidua TaxID=1566151 RepID=A0ABQ9DNU2_9PASS|nr:hypothetical protein WISP_23422 [Willisornis vidua]
MCLIGLLLFASVQAVIAAIIKKVLLHKLFLTLAYSLYFEHTSSILSYLNTGFEHSCLRQEYDQHQIRKCGLDEWTVSWIKNHLNGRTQRLIIDGTESSWRPMTNDVSKGSIPGPVLLNFPINDLPINEGADASSASSLMTQSWGEWPVDQRDVQPFRGTQLAGEMGREELPKIRQRQVQVLHLGRDNLLHQHRLRVTCWKAALQRRI